MKPATLLLCCTALLAAQPTTAGLAGRVTNEATGDPLHHAKLTVERIRPAPATFTAETAGDGTYALTGLAPGTYKITAERMGFLSTAYGAKEPGQPGSPLTIEAADTAAADLVLTPEGVIAGRVLDAAGDPVYAAQVDAMHMAYVNGHRQLVTAPSANRLSATNDLGEYRIFGLAPGRYYVRIVPRRSESLILSPQAISTPDTTTYYASTPTAGDALPLDITAGRTIEGVDIRLARRPAVSVSGTVRNLTGAMGTIAIALFPDGLGSASAATSAGPQGGFVIPGVAPGRYWMRANLITQSGAAGNVNASTKLAVDVGSQPIDNLILTLDNGADLTGTVKIELGPDPIRDLAALHLSLDPAEPSPIDHLFPSPTTQLTADGVFALPAVRRDRYRLSFPNLPPGYYVKSAQAGDLDLLTNPLDLTESAPGPAPGALEIVLSGNPGRVEGTAPAGATLVLVPDPEPRRALASWYHVARTDQNGAFVLPNVPPGPYHLYTFEAIEEGAWMDPEILQPQQDRSIAVEVRESVIQTVAITP